jgi:Dicarboxylate transport
MSHENNNQTQGESAQETERENSQKSLFRSVFNAQVLSLGSFALTLGTITILGVWLNRNIVVETTLEGFLKTKGIDAKIDFDELQLDGAKFHSLHLSKAGKDSLVAQNGQIQWHINAQNQFELDKFAASKVFFTFGINDKGLDWGALSPLFSSKSENGAKTLLHDISIEKLNLLIKTKFGDFALDGRVISNDSDGVGAAFFIHSPQELLKTTANKNIQIALQTTNINKMPLGIGVKLTGDEIMLGQKLITPQYKIGAIAIKATSNLQINEDKPITIEILPSQISAKSLTGDELSAQNINLDIDRSFVLLAADLQKDLIFTTKGKLNLNKVKFGNNILQNTNLGFEIARAQNGQSRAVLNGDVQNANIGLALKSGKINAQFDAFVPQIDKILEANGKGKIIIDLNKIRAPLANSLKKNMAQTSFAGFANEFSTKAAFLIEKNKSIINIIPQDKIIARAADGSIIVLESDKVAQFNGVKFDLSKPEDFQFAMAGKLKAKTRDNLTLDAKILSLDAANDYANIVIGKSSAKNVKIADQIIDLDINKLSLNQQTGKKLSGNFATIAKFHGVSNGLAAVNGKIIADNIDVSLDGKFKTLKSRDFNVNDLIIKGDVRGNLKDQLYINTNANAKYASAAEYKITGLSSAIALDYNPNNTKHKLKLSSHIDKIIAPNIYGLNVDLNANGIAKIADELGFAGNIDGKINSFVSTDTIIKTANLKGPINFAMIDGINIINATNCVDFSVESLNSGDTKIDNGYGAICPDEKGRILAIEPLYTKFYARPQIGEISLALGKGNDAPKFKISKLNGGFVPNSFGGNSFKGNASDLSFEFLAGPNQWAQIQSKNTDISVQTTKNGTLIGANIAQFSALGLPVELAGSLQGDMQIPNNQKPSANFNLSNIWVRDKAQIPMFTPFTLNGRGQLENDKINLFGDAKLENRTQDLAQIYLEHNIANGIGNVVFDASKLTFSSQGIGSDPPLGLSDIIPSLKGIFNEATGVLDTRAGVSWAPNSDVKSYAKIGTDNLSFSTELGLVSGINGQVEIADLFALKTAQQQIVKVGLFDPGIPIEEGNLGFALKGNNSIDLNLVEWAFAGGKLSMRPLNIPFAEGPKDLIIEAKDVDIAKLLRLAKVPNLEIDGVMSGALPIKIVDNTFEIVGGYLTGNGEGVLRYTGPDFSQPAPKAKGLNAIKQKLFGKPAPSPTEIAMSALRELHYKVLRIEVDGRITGEIQLNVLLEGANPELLANHPIRFNVKANLPIGQIINSYNSVFENTDEFITQKVLNHGL